MRTIDIEIVLGEHLWAIVNRITRTVEYPSQHILGDGKLHATAREFDMSRLYIDTRRSLEDLHDGLLALDFENLSAARCTIR